MDEKGKRKTKRIRHKTIYPGVFYYVSKRLSGKGTERVYYYRFKKDGKHYEEKAGRQRADDMTGARASAIRSERIEGKRESRKEKRQKEIAEKLAQESIYTLDRVWDAYVEFKGGANSWPNYVTDRGIYKNHVAPYFGKMLPHDILPLDIARATKKLKQKKVTKHGWGLALEAAKKRQDHDAIKSIEKRINANNKTLSPQTIKHALALLRRLCKFCVDKQLCDGPNFRFDIVSVDNEITEDLNPDQLNRLLNAIDKDTHPCAGTIMKLALFTGMRRSEMFRLTWNDINFEREFIWLRNTKGGRTEKIPLNQATADLFMSIPRTGNKYVFPGRSGHRKDINKHVNRIKINADLPSDFRPLHGLRHVFASMLASSGQVDMYTLQKLLTHKSPLMTQRYSHLRDEALKRASNLAGDLITKAINGSNNVKSEQN